jgi:hypothetical protein
MICAQVPILVPSCCHAFSPWARITKSLHMLGDHLWLRTFFVFFVCMSLKLMEHRICGMLLCANYIQ